MAFVFCYFGQFLTDLCAVCNVIYIAGCMNGSINCACTFSVVLPFSDVLSPLMAYDVKTFAVDEIS